MFTPDDIQSRVRQRPFVPIRFVLSTGPTYDVYHPDMVWIGRRDIQIGLPSSENPSQYEQASRIAILHITEMRDLPVSSVPKNGAT